MQCTSALLDGVSDLCKAPKRPAGKVKLLVKTALESRAPVSCLTQSDNKNTIRQRFTDDLAQFDL